MDKKQSWDGSYYKKHSQPQFQSAMAIIDTIHFKGDECILDIGCGNGKTTVEIAKKVPRGCVIGIDNSSHMIDQAQQDSAHIKNISFVCIDATQINYDNQFDYIFSFSTLHWIEDKKAVFNAIYSALKKGGALRIKCGSNEDSPIKRAIEYVSKQPRWKGSFDNQASQFRGVSGKEYKSLAQSAGLKNIKVEHLSSIRQIEFQSFVDWLMGWVPYSTGLPQSEARKVSEILTKYLYDEQQVPYHAHLTYESPGTVHIEASK
jgi:trans-aconitate 2-methyltransferase